MLKTISIGISCVLFLSSCMTYDPYTDEKKVSSSTTGAIIGGLAGAALGNQVKGSRHTRDNAMIAGALLGMAAGGAIGNKMDQQAAALRQKLRGTGVSVTKSGNRVILNMPGNITFAKGSAIIQPDFDDVLDSVAEVMKEYKKTEAEISGHADSSGSIEANQALSQQRANAVASSLRNKGVSGRRLNAVGYGKSSSLGGDGASDRRVEISLSTPE